MVSPATRVYKEMEINTETKVDVSQAFFETQSTAAQDLITLATRSSNKQLTAMGYGANNALWERLLAAADTVANIEGRTKDAVLAEVDECRLTNGIITSKSRVGIAGLQAHSRKRDKSRLLRKLQLRSSRTDSTTPSIPSEGSHKKPIGNVEGESQPRKVQTYKEMELDDSQVQADKGVKQDESSSAIGVMTSAEAHEILCYVADKPCPRANCTVCSEKKKEEVCLPQSPKLCGRSDCTVCPGNEKEEVYLPQSPDFFPETEKEEVYLPRSPDLDPKTLPLYWTMMGNLCERVCGSILCSNCYGDRTCRRWEGLGK